MRVDPYVIEAGRGPAVVLLHAFPLNASMWAAQREALADGYRVVCPDQRGFGGTPLYDHGDPSLDEVADDVAALLDKLKVDRCALGGLSMGGYVAMAFLRRHPERVRALVLADTKATADPPEAAANRLRIAEEVVAAGHSKQLVDEVLPKLVGEEDELSPPADARAMAEAVPGAEIVTIPEAGHLTAVETPEEFNAALREFLDRLPPE